jgi:hypothetical protein
MTGAEEITGHYSTAAGSFVNRAGIFRGTSGTVALERMRKTDRGGHSTNARVDIHIDMDSLV